MVYDTRVAQNTGLYTCSTKLVQGCLPSQTEGAFCSGQLYPVSGAVVDYERCHSAAGYFVERTVFWSV